MNIDEGVMVSWTPEMLARFKSAIASAKGLSGFTFDGNRYDRRYAELLAEYLEGEFKRRGKNVRYVLKSLGEEGK